MPGVKPGNSTTTTTNSNRKTPKVIHPLSTPGYVIIFKFITTCFLNILGFVLTYALLLIAIPLSLLVKFVQKIAVLIRVKYESAKAEYGSAAEAFWFLTSSEDRRPSVILVLAVKGSLDTENVQRLLRNRLTSNCEETLEDRGNCKRLKRTPKRVFRELVWFENNAESQATVVLADMDAAYLFTPQCNVITVQEFADYSEWQVSLYSGNGNLGDESNSIILLNLRHCIADLHTLVYAMSRSFLDRPAFVFREEITPTQGCCLGLLAFLAGPSIFARTLMKPRDFSFTEPPSFGRKRAIFYSEPVGRNEVDIVTTATGTSVCDVILSCLAGSFRSCLKQQGIAFPDDVTVYYPMNLESSNSLRCFTSFNIFSLPVGTEGAIPRLWEMRLRRSNVSAYVEAITTSAIMQLAFLILPASAATRLIEYLVNKTSCTINSILGHNLDQELLLDGRPVENFIPLEDRGFGLSVTIIELKGSFQLAVLAPSSQDYVIKPGQLCVEFARHMRALSARLTERARVVRARGQKILNSRRNSVFIVEEDEG